VENVILKCRLILRKLKNQLSLNPLFNSYFNELFKIPCDNLKVYYYRAQRYAELLGIFLKFNLTL
jgi:hypothetical protein